MSGKSNRKFPDSTMMIWSIFYQLTWLLATTQTTDTERRDLMRFFTALQCHSISINQTRDGLPLTRSRKGSNCQSSVKCKRWVWWWSLSLLLMNRVSRIFSRRMFLFFSRLPAPSQVGAPSGLKRAESPNLSLVGLQTAPPRSNLRQKGRFGQVMTHFMPRFQWN